MIKYLLALAFVLLSAPCFAVLTRTYTIKESGGDYTSLQAAETAHDQDYVANDSALTFEISGIWTSADGATSFQGSVSDATRFPTIIAIGDSKAGATWSTTAYRAVAAASTVINVQDNDITFDGLQVHLTYTGGSILGAISGNSTGRQIVQNCFLKGNTTGTTLRGIFMNNNALDNCIIRNNIVVDFSDIGIFVSGATAGFKVDNNTVENCGDAIRTNPEDGIARNNIVFNSTTPFVGDWNTTTLSEENYTDAGSLSYGSCGSCGTGDQVSQSDPFVNLAGENYHLASGATAIDAGKDLSGAFTDAIGGKTRDANFDKGADEFIAAATGQKIMIRKAMMFWLW